MDALLIQPLTTSFAVPSLETIPGSRTDTPAQTPLSSITPTPESGSTPTTSSSSRIRSSPLVNRPFAISTFREPHQEVVLDDSIPPMVTPESRIMPGSYFSVPISVRAHTPFSNSPATTPSADRPLPPPLSIPPSTPEEPLFQAYPPKTEIQSTPQRIFHLKSSFTLRHPRFKGRDEGSKSADQELFKNVTPQNRRRSWTTSEHRYQTTSEVLCRRRASIGSTQDIRSQPSACSPPVLPRRSSLAPALGLSELTTNIVLQPPCRTSSLVCEHDEPVSIESIVSEISSPSMSSKHPLSSATTSISRSAKSCEDDHEPLPLSPRAPRSQRRGLALLELVETEVTYLDDLQTLLHVYLPQLAAMPGVSEQTRKLVTRNTGQLCLLHTDIVSDMVDILRSEGVGYGTLDGKAVERATQKIVNVLMNHGFEEYNEFTAQSIKAEAAVSQISQRHDYAAFERRCETVSSTQPHQTLLHLLTGAPALSSNRSRLRFRDLLIHPYQRVCRYPMLLRRIMDSVPDEEHFDYNVDVDLDRAHKMMTAVADQANRSRRDAEAEMTTAIVTQRLEPHPFLSRSFIASLGMCQLVGALDVLHYHPTLAPNLKVKYFGAVLFPDYLVLFKVKRGIIYEPKHFFPVSIFSIVEGGMLPHAIGLTHRDHHFELASSSKEEKAIWLDALRQSENGNPSYDRPSSVSSKAPTSTQRQSAEISPSTSTSIRDPFVRRASAAQRNAVDKGLEDVTSIVCATARRPVSLFEPITPTRRHSFFDPHMTAGSVLRSSHSSRLGMMNSSSSSVANVGGNLLRRDSSVRIGRKGVSGNSSLTSVADMASSVSDFGIIQPGIMDVGTTRSRRIRKTLSSFSLNTKSTHQSRAKSMPVSPAITPPMGSLELPIRAEASPVAGPRPLTVIGSGENAIAEDEGDVGHGGREFGDTDGENEIDPPLYMTGYFDIPSRLSRVRRSFSFFKRNDTSIVAVPNSDIIATVIPSRNGDGARLGQNQDGVALEIETFSSNEIGCAETEEGQGSVAGGDIGDEKSAIMSANSSSQSQSQSPAYSPASTPSSSPFVSPAGTPSRKRSLRLFGSLRGFTPAHTIAG